MSRWRRCLCPINISANQSHLFILDGPRNPRKVPLPRGPLHVRLLQFCQLPIVADLLDEVALALMHEDGALVQLEDGARPFNLLEDLVPPVCRVNDMVRLVVCRPDADVLGRVGAVPIVAMKEPFFVCDQALLAELRQIRAKVPDVVLAASHSARVSTSITRTRCDALTDGPAAHALRTAGALPG